jgi:hypothetical protein
MRSPPFPGAVGRGKLGRGGGIRTLGLFVPNCGHDGVALWLGHERAETAQIYIHADQTLKERALARTTPPTPLQDATGRPTPCSPSSNSSAENLGYAEVPTADTATSTALNNTSA